MELIVVEVAVGSREEQLQEVGQPLTVRHTQGAHHHYNAGRQGLFDLN